MRALKSFTLFTFAVTFFVTGPALALTWKAVVTHENQTLASTPGAGVHKLYLPKTRWMCHVEDEIVRDAGKSSTRFISCELPQGKDNLKFPVLCDLEKGVTEGRINLVDNRGRRFTVSLACEGVRPPELTVAPVESSKEEGIAVREAVTAPAAPVSPGAAPESQPSGTVIEDAVEKATAEEAAEKSTKESSEETAEKSDESSAEPSSGETSAE